MELHRGGHEHFFSLNANEHAALLKFLSPRKKR